MVLYVEFPYFDLPVYFNQNEEKPFVADEKKGEIIQLGDPELHFKDPDLSHPIHIKHLKLSRSNRRIYLDRNLKPDTIEKRQLTVKILNWKKQKIEIFLKIDNFRLSSIKSFVDN